MKPIKTKDTQATFGKDMPYRFIRTTQGACIAVTWQLTFMERIKLLIGGKFTVQTYAANMPPMIIKLGDKV